MNRMPLDDESLRQAYRQAHDSAAGPHLSEDEWEQLACGALDAGATERAHNHITACTRCAEIRRSISVVAEEAAQFDPHAVRPAITPAAGSRTWFYVGGLAAAAALFAAVSLDLGGPRQSSGGEVMRTSIADTVIGAVAPTANTALIGRRFAWQPVATADVYELRINAADGAAVWTTRGAATEATLPLEINVSRGQFYWQVTAFRDHAAIGTSPLVPFRIE